MNEGARRARNELRLKECAPAFAHKARAILMDLEGHDLRPRIQCAYRPLTEQRRLHKLGVSWTVFGFHNIVKDDKPYAFAVDVLDDNDPEGEYNTEFYRKLKRSAQAHNLDCPIKGDECHVQPGSFKSAPRLQGRVKTGKEIEL